MYQLCWIRSVEVAIRYQEKETEALQYRAAAHFMQAAKGEAKYQDEHSHSVQRKAIICDEDITSPHSYSISRRYLGTTPESEEDDDWIPPAMFCEYTDDSYIASYQEDVRLRADESISSGELEDLAYDGSQSSRQQDTSDTESTYSPSQQSDVLFRNFAPLRLSEVRALDACQSLSPGVTSLDSGSTNEVTAREARLLWAQDEGRSQGDDAIDGHHRRAAGTVTRDDDALGSQTDNHYSGGEEGDSERDRQAPRILRRRSSSHDITDESEAPDSQPGLLPTKWRVPFPLQEIGPIMRPNIGGEAQSSWPYDSEVGGEQLEEPTLTVYGEFRGEADSAQAFPL